MDDTQTRIAFYACLYLDKPHEVPIKSQFRACYVKLGKQPFEHAGYYSDQRFISATGYRSGLKALLRDAQNGKVDAVLVYAMDRLGLNPDNLTEIARRFTNAGVEVFACINDGMGLCEKMKAEIEQAEQEKIYQAAMAWERYWDEQMEVAEQDYPQPASTIPPQDLTL